MPVVGLCALCQVPNSALQGSHIVPEFFYKRIYTKSHKFTAIPLEGEERLAVEQKGYRENLLCADCETKLSKWEGALSQFVNQVVSESYTTCSASSVGSVTIVSGVEYASVKMAVLSIFWRMSLAKHELFASYDLGPYQDVFRSLLHKTQVPKESEFPVLISRGLLDGNFLPGILFPMSRGRYDNLIMQSVVLNGVLFDCIVTNKQAIPSEVLEFSLQSSGRVLVPNRSYESLGANVREFAERMKRDDVKGFYQKYG